MKGLGLVEFVGIGLQGLESLGSTVQGYAQRAQYPLIKEYGLNYIGHQIMI